MEGLDQTLVVILSAIAAAVSFIAFVLPMLSRSEKKERFQSIIEKRRKDLFIETREAVNKKTKKEDDSLMSASESLVTFYKVQHLMGEMGKKVRLQMLQAGNRDPGAPLKYMIARVVFPLVLMAFSMFIISSSEEEMSNAMVLFILGMAVLVGYKLPYVLLKNQILKRAEEINLTFPDALDMMLICVQGGIGLEQTVDRIATEISEHSETLAEELAILSAEMAMLNDRRQALQDFAERVGSGAAKSFASALVQAEQYGTSVSQAMRVMSDELREQRMAAAEQKAASLPPKLTVPMIAFFLPVLFVVILGPAILDFMSQ
jgi:tight adherence protein C